MEPEFFPIWRPWFVALKAVDVAIIKALTDARLYWREAAGGKLQLSQLNERLQLLKMSADVLFCKVTV